jgi:ABC-type transporter Mla maintaining outer membrane lipid asymmetry ATPase subunit MlaF
VTARPSQYDGAPLVFDQVLLSPRAATPFSLTVERGETVVVLGDVEAGLGLLGALALALEIPRAGHVRVLGTDLALLSARECLAFRRRVGYLPAGGGLLQNLSLRDNVALPLRFGSAAAPREIEGRVDVMMAAGRIGGIGGLRPAQANDEERRRTALIRALAFDPSLLILEQPFDGLATRVTGELLTLARGGETAEGARRSVLITCHEVPPVLHNRVERVYRLARQGALELEPA